MEKDMVIKIRDALKSGKNYPLLVYLDNSFKLINESDALKFTKWDDANGILYSFSISDVNFSNATSNVNNTISVYACDYEQIQAMEVAELPLPYLPTIIDGVNAAGANITDEWKQRIIKMFTGAFKDMANLSPSMINHLMGIRDGEMAVNDKDDYYRGRFTEPFLETRAMAERNKYADKVKAEAEKQEESKS